MAYSKRPLFAILPVPENTPETDNVPKLMVVVPECDTAPAKERVPIPDLVRLPVPMMLPPKIMLTGLSTLIVAMLPALMVNPRSVLVSEVPEIMSVPPAKTRFAASLDEAPRVLAVPPFPSELASKTPPFSLVSPVYRFCVPSD